MARDGKPSEHQPPYPILTGPITLRDYFAIHAMNGLYSGNPNPLRLSEKDLASDAEVAYRIADAMIAERNK